MRATFRIWLVACLTAAGLFIGVQPSEAHDSNCVHHTRSTPYASWTGYIPQSGYGVISYRTAFAIDVWDHCDHGDFKIKWLIDQSGAKGARVGYLMVGYRTHLNNKWRMTGLRQVKGDQCAGDLICVVWGTAYGHWDSVRADYVTDIHISFAARTADTIDSKGKHYHNCYMGSKACTKGNGG